MTTASLKVEVGFNAGPFTAQASVTWTDITAYVFSSARVTVQTGRSTELDQFQPGSCTLTLKNDARRFDPDYTAGPYYGSLRPLRPLRITATVGATTYPVFYGYVQAWPQSYQHPDASTVQVTAIDGFSLLSNDALAGGFILGSATYGKLGTGTLGVTVAVPSALSGSLIGTMLNYAGWPTADRALDAGQVTMATQDVGGSSALASMQDVAFAEFGQLFMGRDGTITFQDRSYRTSNTRSTVSQVTLTDDSAGSNHYVQVAYNDDQRSIINDIRFTNTATDMVISSVDGPSITEFGRRQLTKSAAVVHDMDLETTCTSIIARYGQPQQRIENIDAVVVNADRLATLLDLRTSDRVTARRLPQGVGTAISADYFLEGWSWDFRLVGTTAVDVSWSAYVTPV